MREIGIFYNKIKSQNRVPFHLPQVLVLLLSLRPSHVQPEMLKEF